MEKLNALMESEEMKSFTENNQEMINETAQAAEAFSAEIRDYVIKNPEIFIEAKVTDIEKNIRIFTEVAMCQFLTETTAINSVNTKIVEPVTEENVLNDYI
jgi:hypothetical protein